MFIRICWFCLHIDISLSNKTLGEARIKVSPDCTTSTSALVSTFRTEEYYSVQWRWTANIQTCFPVWDIIHILGRVKLVRQLAALFPACGASERVSLSPTALLSWQHADPGYSYMLLISLSFSSNLIVHNSDPLHWLVLFKPCLRRFQSDVTFNRCARLFPYVNGAWWLPTVRPLSCMQ